MATYVSKNVERTWLDAILYDLPSPSKQMGNEIAEFVHMKQPALAKYTRETEN